MFSYCLKSLRGAGALEEYQEIDADKIWTTFLWNIIKSIKNVQKLPVAGVYCDSNWLGATICTGLKKIMTFQKGNKNGFWIICMLYCRRRKIV